MFIKALGTFYTINAAWGARTTHTCNYAGQTLTSVRATGGLSHTTRAQYDALGRRVASWASATEKTEYQYDALGRLVRQTSPFDHRSATTKFYYGAAGKGLYQKVLDDDG